MRKGAADFAAVLIFIFAILIILYILLIPETDRNELIGIENNNGGEFTPTDKDIILDESPGQINDVGRTQYEYTVPSIYLASFTGAEVIKSENPFIVKNGWLMKKTKDIEFEIEDLDVVDNLILSFNADVREGNLILSLNDEVFYENKIENYNAEPVILPKEKMKRGKNTISFSASSVGLKFWAVNDYALEDVKILGDVTDETGLDTKEVFFIPEERNNVKTASLKYIPECEESSQLRIYINNQMLFSGIPKCKILNSIIVPPEYLETGTNTIEFRSERAAYLVEQIKIKTDLKSVSYPTYYFNLDEEWEDIESNDYYVNFTLDFLVPEDEYTSMKVTVNNRDFGIYQREDEYSKVVDEYLQEGNNVIRLVPEDQVDVISMRLVLVEE